MVRYWIGGTGITTDTAHWSDTSGGTGGFSIPTISDDVIFDNIVGANQTVTASNLQCATLTISIAVNCSLVGTITCAGNINKTAQNMSTTNLALILDGAGGSITNNASAQGSWKSLTMLSGTWDLMNYLSLNNYNSGILRLEAGTFNSNNYNIDCKQLTCTNDDSLTRNLNFGTSIITISGYNTSYGSVLKFNGNATNLSGDYTIKMTHTTYYDGTLIETKADLGGVNLNYVEVSHLSVKINGGKINELKLAASSATQGSTVTWGSGTDNVLEECTTIGTDNYPVYFISSSPTNTYNIAATALTLDRYAISNCIANDQPIYANNSSDDGLNTDVIFDGSSKRIKKYWVGGNGTNTTAHWSNSSGGTPGTTKPTYKYDAIFDANSFTATGQTVDCSASLGEITCKSMDWTGALYNPTFKGKSTTSQAANIYGSLTLIEDMIFQTSFVPSIAFLGYTTGNTITTAGHIFNGIYIQSDTSVTGTQGEYTLQDDVICTGGFSLTRGILHTNDKNITCNTFNSSISSNPYTKELYLGSSTISYKSSFDTANTYMILDAGTSTIKSYVVGGLPLTSSFNSSKTFYNLELGGVADYINGAAGVYASFNNVKVVIPAGLVGNKKLYIQKDRHITINGTLTGDGTPTNNVELLSSPVGSHYIDKASGIVSVNYWNIINSNAGGGATFYANNSIDSGNNTGWIFGPPPSIGLNIYYGTIPVIKIYKGTTEVTHMYHGNDDIF